MPRLLVNGNVVFDLPDTSHEAQVINAYLIGCVVVDMSDLGPEEDTHVIRISLEGVVWNVGGEPWIAVDESGEVNVVVSHEGIGAFCLGSLQGVLETHKPVRPAPDSQFSGRTHRNDKPYFVR